MQLAPATHAVSGLLIDLAMVAAAVAAFAIVLWAITGQALLGSLRWYSGLLLGCGSWVLYRYLLFGRFSLTPGEHVAAAVAGRVLAWIYNRRLHHARSPE